MIVNRAGLILALACAVGFAVAPVAAQESSQPACAPVAEGQVAEEVVPGVTVTWDHSLRCNDPPDSGNYAFSVTVTNAGDSGEAVVLDRLALSHATPPWRGPNGQGASATFAAAGLPLTVNPGESRSFDVSGSYELSKSAAGGAALANLHFRASAHAVRTGTSFILPVDVHLAPADEDDGEAPGGPRASVSGPPAAVCNRQGEDRPPPWVCRRASP